MQTHDTTPVLTATEAASFLNVDDKTLANWRSSQKGPNYLKLCGCVRYRMTDLLHFIENGLVEPSSGKYSAP